MASPVRSPSSPAAMAIAADQRERPLTPLDVALSEAATHHLASPPPPPPPIDDPLVNGIKTLFDPTIKQTTEKLMQVHKSQLALSDELERLITQLQIYLEHSEPPAIRPTVVKLAQTSKRLAAVNGELSQLPDKLPNGFTKCNLQPTYDSGFTKYSTSSEQVISTA
ncbi:hypothetical protein EV426DRAFT_578679 [Tirmania nivea]|nr:hypothetical protein EV426DRAFT_578679 [Tirmania nivea]